MELYIKDRIYLSKILPECKSFLEFNLKRNILSKVQITEKDHEKYNIVIDHESGQVKWNHTVDMAEPLSVSFSDEEKALIRRGCEAIDDTPYPDDFWVSVEKFWVIK